MRLIIVLLFAFVFTQLSAQNLTQVKKELETTADPIGYVKFKLKKKYSIDTVTILSTSNFLGISDSIAYKGKTGKVYGPFKGSKVLLKILGKVPNTFYHVNHIVIDTGVFSKKFADSMATKLMDKIRSGEQSFEQVAKVYSADPGSARKGGDLGWFIRGVMLPQLDEAIASHKKGELFKVWTPAGLHIVTIKDNPKKDDGFALILRVIL
jgi:hypothetical protein